MNDNQPDRQAVTAQDVLRRYNDETLPDFCDPLQDVNQAGTFGNRPIHLASYRGEMKDLIALVDAGADVNAPGDLGVTALHEAVGEGHAAAVSFLLSRGAITSVTDELGRTPLSIAESNGRQDILQLLRGN